MAKRRLSAMNRRILDDLKVSAEVRAALEQGMRSEALREERLTRAIRRYLVAELRTNEITPSVQQLRAMTGMVLAAAFRALAETLEAEVDRLKKQHR